MNKPGNKMIKWMTGESCPTKRQHTRNHQCERTNVYEISDISENGEISEILKSKSQKPT